MPNGGTRLLTQNWLAVQTDVATPQNLQHVRFFDADGNPDTPSGVRVIYTGNGSAYMYRTTAGTAQIGTGSVRQYISPQVSLARYQWCQYVIKYI